MALDDEMLLKGYTKSMFCSGRKPTSETNGVIIIIIIKPDLHCEPHQEELQTEKKIGDYQLTQDYTK